MKYIKIISYLFLLLAVLFFQSCRSTRHVLKEGGFDFKVVPDQSQKNMLFNEFFYNGYKEANLDNNNEKATSDFLECLKLDPRSAAAMYNLARIYAEEKRYSEAAELMKKAVSIETGNHWYLEFLGDLYFADHNFNGAINAYTKLIREFPFDPDIYYKLSGIYLDVKKPLNAVKVLDELEKKTGPDRSLTEQKKAIYLSMNRLDKAVEEIEKLISSDPSNPEYLKMLIEVYAANGIEKKVYPLYEKLLRIDSTDNHARLALADHYLKTGQKAKGFAMAEIAFKDPSLEIDNKIAFLYYNFLQKKDSANVSNVLHFADILVAAHPDDSKSWAFRGDVLNELGEKTKALADYHQALIYEKNLVTLWKKVILLEFENKNYPVSAGVAKEAIDYFPNDPELFFYLGVVYNIQKKYDSAVTVFNRGIDWVLSNPQLKSQYYSNMAEAYNGLKEYAKSDMYFDKAIRLDSMDATSLNNYAYYLSLRKEKLDSAEMLSKRSLAIEPDNAAFLDTYGWILYLKGDYREAEKYIKKALDIRPGDGDVLEHFGDVLYRLGRTTDAVDYWEKAAKSGTKSDILERKIRDKKLYE